MQRKCTVTSLIMECQKTRSKRQPAISELGVMLNLRSVSKLFVSQGLGLNCVADIELCQYHELRTSLMHTPIKIFTFHMCSYVRYLTTL